MLPEVSKEEALTAFANYCSQNNTPSDIFAFDGLVPTIQLRYSPILGVLSDFNYTALVQITTENEYHTTSQLGANTTAARNNAKNPSGGFFESMYEDRYDTRYETTKATNTYMDRSNGTGWVFAFTGSGNSVDTVEEKLWPDESIDKEFLLEPGDYRVITNDTVQSAVSKCISGIDFDNAQMPQEKITTSVSEYIEKDLKSRYSKCNYQLIDSQFELVEDSISTTPLLFPYYEISFIYKGVAYHVRVCAHNQARASTGIFGGKKEIAVGDLPAFIKEPGGLITKMKAHKERKNAKQEGKEKFLREIADYIVLLT